jgi:hypothetical protein
VGLLFVNHNWQDQHVERQKRDKAVACVLEPSSSGVHDCPVLQTGFGSVGTHTLEASPENGLFHSIGLLKKLEGFMPKAMQFLECLLTFLVPEIVNNISANVIEDAPDKCRK